MVPSFFVMMKELPLTATGKLDRRALPPPDRALLEEQEKHVAPRTLVEELLADIWADVLKLGHVGIHDSFFDVGGHSLLATQLMSRVNTAFRTNLALRVL